MRSEQYRAYQRSRYAKMTLERRERKRRYERDMTNLKRREQGIPPRNFRTRKVDLGPNPFYDAAKVYEHIQRFMIYEPRVEDRKGPEELRLNGIPVNETDQRRIRAWSTGEAKMVHQSTLDRIITTYDLSWWEFEEFAVRIAA